MQTSPARPAGSSPVRRPAILTALWIAISCVAAGPSRATLLKEGHFDMTVLPESETSPWSRVGGGHAFLLPDHTLVVNDNSFSDKIAYQTLLGDVKAEHRVTLGARVRVLSNLGGDAVTLEIDRPGLEVALQLYPDRMILVERASRLETRWLGTVDVDLTDFRDVILTKSSSLEDPPETISVVVDGQVLLQAKPRGESTLRVGRLMLGSSSMDDVGASFWDWVSYRLESVDSGVSTQATSFGRVKASY